MSEIIQERAFFHSQSHSQIKVLLLIIYKDNRSATPFYFVLGFLAFATGNGNFFISTGISALAGSSWGQQLHLVTGADSLELSSIWPKTEPLRKQAIFRQTLPRDIKSLREIIFRWSFSHNTPNSHRNEIQRQP